MEHPLAKERYVRLTTYRRSGEAVSNPMWIGSRDGRLYMVTEATSAKVTRLRNDPSIELVASDARGTPRSGAATYRATAELLTDPEGIATARAAYDGKYGVQAKVLGMVVWVQRTLLRRDRPRIGMRLDLEQA
jgi:PPOX class probable F420-dependent enzyme